MSIGILGVSIYLGLTAFGCITAFVGTYFGGRTVVVVGLAMVLADFYLV